MFPVQNSKTVTILTKNQLTKFLNIFVFSIFRKKSQNVCASGYSDAFVVSIYIRLRIAFLCIKFLTKKNYSFPAL